MGHLNHLKREYRALVRRLEAGSVALPEPKDPAAWQGWKEILEILFSPEEASFAAWLPVLPATMSQLEQRYGLAPEQLQPMLDRLCDRGVVLDLVHRETGEVRYALSPPVVGFFEFSLMRAGDTIPKKRMAEALEAYLAGDEAFAREAMGFPTAFGRAVPHEATLEEDLACVLDWERATFLIESARALAVSLCFCRHKAMHLGRACSAPMECCLSLNAGADFVIRRKFGRPVERVEALEHLHRAREAGLVQIADNVQSQPVYLCNCCACCCEQLRGIRELGWPAAVNPSGFVPSHQEGHPCKGCSRCARACPTTAISMVAHAQPSQSKNGLKCSIDEARCIGCGLCVGACKQSAIKLTRRQHPPFVPANPIERMVRMALERGRLADLVDARAGLGSSALHGVIKALTRLPGVEKVLAAEQVRSRFIRAILRRGKEIGV